MAAYSSTRSMVCESYRISCIRFPRNASRVTLYVGHARRIRGSDVYARYYVYASANSIEGSSYRSFVPFASCTMYNIRYRILKKPILIAAACARQVRDKSRRNDETVE